jgi:hypothetical protein
MKIRVGFVSNSSTSSFVCDVCGFTEAGQDVGLDTFGMFRCENEHCVHEKCAGVTETDFLEEALEKYVSSYIGKGYSIEELKEDGEYECRYSVPQKYCPICSFGKLSSRDELEFLRKEAGMTEKEVLKEIRSRFTTYKEFKENLSII